MYKHILIPTDGSKLAAKGIREGVRLAKALGAKITGVYVAAPYLPPIYSEGAIVYAGTRSAAEHGKVVEKAARKPLGAIEQAARAAGVRCGTRVVIEPQPWRGILRAARAARCDAIVMASHGRGAVGGLILGSETSRVLAHSKIPVVVTR
jgi:nucleotide-binding universal stress UspA family protein